MTIDEVYEFRMKIGCIGPNMGKGMDESKCDSNMNTKNACLSLTDEQVLEYVAKYGCICSIVKGPVCPHCICYKSACDGE